VPSSDGFSENNHQERAANKAQDSTFEVWASILWPLGGTLLGLIVIRLAIDQYPEFFHTNTWLLPLSAICVVFCWLAPLFVHQRAWRLVQWIVAIRYAGPALAAILMLALPVVIVFGSVKLFHFHSEHLRNAETWSKLSAPTPSMPSQQSGFDMVPDTKFSIINFGPWDIGDNYVGCRMTMTLDGDVQRYWQFMEVMNSFGIAKNGGLTTFYCFEFVKKQLGAILHITCADVEIEMRYMLPGQHNWASKDFRFLASSGVWTPVTAERREPYCDADGVNGLGPRAP
jgi:hypothetical protein